MKVNRIVNLSVMLIVMLYVTTSTSTLSFETAWPQVTVLVPVDLDYNCGDIYATSLAGQVLTFENDDDEDNEAQIFFDISDKPYFYTNVFDFGEEGLVSFEFHPDFPQVQKFYTVFSSSENTTRVSAWNIVNGEVDYNSQDVLLTINRQSAAEPRIGGDMKFDNNGDLYISVGDGADPTAAQSTFSLLGKILRIRPRAQGSGYTIPNSNPYARNNFGAAEIYNRGYRNPRKILFPKPNSPKLWVGDVGDQYDEINIVDKSNNAGWNVFDGCHCATSSCPSNANQYQFPIYEYTSDESHALTLGVLYPRERDGGDIDSLFNRVLFADLYSGTVYSVQYSDTRSFCRTQATFVAQAEGAFISAILYADGSIFVADAFGAFFGNPSFYRLVQTRDPWDC